jgi:hypothetical protein
MRVIRKSRKLVLFETDTFHGLRSGVYSDNRRMYVLLPRGEWIVHTMMPLVSTDPP